MPRAGKSTHTLELWLLRGAGEVCAAERYESPLNVMKTSWNQVEVTAAHTVNTLNATEWSTLKWLMATFMLWEFYLKKKKSLKNQSYKKKFV